MGSPESANEGRSLATQIEIWAKAIDPRITSLTTNIGRARTLDLSLRESLRLRSRRLAGLADGRCRANAPDVESAEKSTGSWRQCYEPGDGPTELVPSSVPWRK